MQKEKLEEASAQGRGVEEADDVSEQSILDFKEIDVDAQMPCAGKGPSPPPEKAQVQEKVVQHGRDYSETEV